MADVVLLFPRTQWDIIGVTTRLPLAVLYIATYLERHGFSTQIIDQRADDEWQESLTRALADDPIWVGISAMTGMQINNGLAAAQMVRSYNPEIPLVWGGVHPSILPEESLEHPLVDVCVMGEGEATSLELSEIYRDKGHDADLSGVSGIAFRRGGEIIKNDLRSYLPMDDYHPLDYDLIDVENYVLREVAGERSLQITTSRACPWACGYCYLAHVPGGKLYRAESPEGTVDRIQELVERYKVDAIHIIDDEFFIQMRRVRKVCELLVELNLGVTLRTNCRIDNLDKMDMDMLRLIRKAGFESLYLGAESGSDRILKFVDKGITRDQMLRVNLKLREVGISPKYSFMAGFPTETMEEVKETMSLMVRLVTENPDAQTTPIQLYTPYPGTKLYDLVSENGSALPSKLEDWSDWGSWEKCDSSWIPKDDRDFLEKAAHFTFFLDGKTVGDSMTSPVMRQLARLYGSYVRARIRADQFAFMPEVALIKRKLAGNPAELPT